MGLRHVGLLFLLVCSTSTYQIEGSTSDSIMQDSDLEWERMEKIVGEEVVESPALKSKELWSFRSGKTTTPAPILPPYVIIWAGSDEKSLFEPEKIARPLPESAKKILLPSTTPAPAKTDRPPMIEIQCHFDRMNVRVRKELFKTTNSYDYLKLGTCSVNEGNKVFLYFLYNTKSNCGFKKERKSGYLSISIVLHYNPTTAVLRDMPFDIPLECRLPRLFHSYKVGIHPQPMGGTVHKALQPISSFTVSLQDASGKPLSGTKTYTLGQTMYFEAKGPDGTSNSENKRLYINKCFMTSSQNPTSSPKYTVIDNLGCMTDSKVVRQSKFLTSTSKMVQKFSVGALMFKNVASTPTQKVFMHCEISVGPLTPTQSLKACTYNAVTRRWKELYSNSPVCLCCKFTCPSAKQKSFRSMITSQSWKVDMHTEDGYMEVTPQVKMSSPEDVFGLDDSDRFRMRDSTAPEHKDFLNYWDD